MKSLPAGHRHGDAGVKSDNRSWYSDLADCHAQAKRRHGTCLSQGAGHWDTLLKEEKC
jgi:hypothetical protein